MDASLTSVIAIGVATVVAVLYGFFAKEGED